MERDVCGLLTATSDFLGICVWHLLRPKAYKSNNDAWLWLLALAPVCDMFPLFMVIFSSAILQVWLQRDAVQLHVLPGSSWKAPGFLSLLGGFTGKWHHHWAQRPCCLGAKSDRESELRWRRTCSVGLFWVLFLATAMELEEVECRLSWQNWVKLPSDADVHARLLKTFQFSARPRSFSII